MCLLSWIVKVNSIAKHSCELAMAWYWSLSLASYVFSLCFLLYSVFFQLEWKNILICKCSTSIQFFVGPWESPRLTNNPISCDLLRRGWRENELSWPVIQRQINRCSHDALVQLAYAEKEAIKCRLLYCGDNSHGFLCKGFGGRLSPLESKLSNVV